MLEDVASILPMLDCVIYNRMCCALAAVPGSELLCGIKHFCVHKFHAYGHASSCPCSPYVHSRIDKRFQRMNTSVAEQTFAWFRNYAGRFNTMARLRYVFYVTFYVQKSYRACPAEQRDPSQSLRLQQEALPYTSIWLPQACLREEDPPSPKLQGRATSPGILYAQASIFLALIDYCE